MSFVLYVLWHVYVLWLGVSPWKFSPTVKGSRSQGHSLTEIKTFLSIKVIRHNAITQCASGNAWSDVSRSSIRFTYSSVARHIGSCICHNSQTYTWNDVIPYKGRIIRVFSSKGPKCLFQIKEMGEPVHYIIIIIYTGWSKSLCAPDNCIVIIRCTETFWSPCIY